MKTTINVILGVCVVAMLFICWRSIADQQQFDADVEQHEKDVKARLLEIRDAEEAYKTVKGEYCGDWDTLIAFINDGALPTIRKEGILSEEQMEKGLTEEKVAEILHSGSEAEIKENGLEGFVRDTTWVNLKDSLYGPDFDASEICYIPHSADKGDEPQKFDLLAVWIRTKSDALMAVMECYATYDQFLVGDSKQWKREVINRTEFAEGQGNFPGLKIGDASLSWNNNAGNWE